MTISGLGFFPSYIFYVTILMNLCLLCQKYMRLKVRIPESLQHNSALMVQTFVLKVFWHHIGDQVKTDSKGKKAIVYWPEFHSIHMSASIWLRLISSLDLSKSEICVSVTVVAQSPVIALLSLPATAALWFFFPLSLQETHSCLHTNIRVGILVCFIWKVAQSWWRLSRNIS